MCDTGVYTALLITHVLLFFKLTNNVQFQCFFIHYIKHYSTILVVTAQPGLLKASYTTKDHYQCHLMVFASNLGIAIVGVYWIVKCRLHPLSQVECCMSHPPCRINCVALIMSHLLCRTYYVAYIMSCKPCRTYYVALTMSPATTTCVSMRHYWQATF